MNELLALSLARKNEIAEIVEFYGATVKGKNVCIFMEYMAGKKTWPTQSRFLSCSVVINMLFNSRNSRESSASTAAGPDLFPSIAWLI